MTFQEAGRAVAENGWMATVGRLASIASVGLLVPGLMMAISIAREHERAIASLQASELADRARLERSEREWTDLTRRISAAENAASTVVARLDEQARQLTRIERLLETQIDVGRTRP